MKDSHCNTPTTVLYNWTFYPFIDLLDTDKFVQHLWRGKRIAAKSVQHGQETESNISCKELRLDKGKATQLQRIGKNQRHKREKWNWLSSKRRN